DILIVDEVLAVGDASFQKKCLGKIDEIAQRRGRTVLVVSHNMGLITSLCHSALLLDRGNLICGGAAADVVRHYYAGGDGSRYELDLSASERAVGDQFATLVAARVETLDGVARGEMNIGWPFRVVMRYRLHQEEPGPFTPVIQFRNAQGQNAFMSIGVR